MLERLFNWRFWPLFFKEVNELRRNRRMIGMMLLPPTLNLVLLGFAMNPEVTNLRLGIVDESRTAESRELISAFTESRSFTPSGRYSSVEELSRALSMGRARSGSGYNFRLRDEADAWRGCGSAVSRRQRELKHGWHRGWLCGARHRCVEREDLFAQIDRATGARIFTRFDFLQSRTAKLLVHRDGHDRNADGDARRAGGFVGDGQGEGSRNCRTTVDDARGQC